MSGNRNRDYCDILSWTRNVLKQDTLHTAKTKSKTEWYILQHWLRSGNTFWSHGWISTRYPIASQEINSYAVKPHQDDEHLCLCWSTTARPIISHFKHLPSWPLSLSLSSNYLSIYLSLSSVYLSSCLPVYLCCSVIQCNVVWCNVI